MDGHERQLWELDNFANAYRNWLMSSMEAEDYGVLFDILHATEFTWSIAMDADRADNGIELRRQFAEDSGLGEPPGIMDIPCSFLEMLVALAMDIDTVLHDPELGDQTPRWFWDILANLGLESCDDEWMFEVGSAGYSMVVDSLDRVLRRVYSPTGFGGLFPLKSAPEDQRKLPIWSQANEWMVEKIGC